MLGKASEIKTKKVSDGWVGTGEARRSFWDVDDAINSFLKDLPPGTEIISIQYQTTTNNEDCYRNALIIYKEAKEDE